MPHLSDHSGRSSPAPWQGMTLLYENKKRVMHFYVKRNEKPRLSHLGELLELYGKPFSATLNAIYVKSQARARQYSPKYAVL